jgi:hypothetical protein
MAVARWRVKYSGAGARIGKYKRDIPMPTRKPCVRSNCQMEWQKEAGVKPAAIKITPEIVIVLVDESRRTVRFHPCAEDVIADHRPCSMRDITGFTRMPPAQVKP